MTPYYEHGGITIYHGDCREVLPHVTADVLVTDPPYGVNLGEHQSASETRPGYIAKQGYASYADTDSNLREIVAPAIATALLMTKRGVVFCAGSKIGAFPEGSCVGGGLPAGWLRPNTLGVSEPSTLHFLRQRSRTREGRKSYRD